MGTVSISGGNRTEAANILDIVPIAGRIGAEIRGVKLGSDLADEVVSVIRAALLKYKVVFFRGQELDDESHEAFAALMGEPLLHPTVPPAKGSRFLFPLDSKEGVPADSWHTDITFLPAFASISILRSMVVPAKGGDTLWANCAAAYESLPATLRAMADGMRAIHTNLFDYALRRPIPVETDGSSKPSIFTSVPYETEHPVVHVHPETGERSLLLGSFVKRITGLGPEDSAAIYQVLQNHITRPENTVRWRWALGDVAMWDNRATQHRAIADYDGLHRVMRRATVAGTVAVDIDGRPSRSL